MLKTESDLMKGIDDKFQKLLSQFEMNMNILEMKSKRQQFIQTNEKTDDSIPKEVVKKETTKHPTQVKEVPNSSGNSSSSTVRDGVSFKGIRETGSDKSESMVTVRETGVKTHPKPKTYTMKLELKGQPPVHEEIESDNGTAEHSDSMGNVLKYISECAEMKNRKNKKLKKMISFSGQNEGTPAKVPKSQNSNSSLVINKKITKKKKMSATVSNDNFSGGGSNKKSEKNNCEVMRKCSKTVTNISRKAKKKVLRNSNNNSKDWISFNRNNAGKKSKAQPKKSSLIKNEDLKQLKKTPTDKPKNNKETDNKQVNEIEHFDVVENKLINDFFKNDYIQNFDVRSKNRMNDILRKTPEKNQIKKRNEEKISFRTKSPLKVVDQETKTNELNTNKNQGFLTKKLNDNKKNVQDNNRGKENKFMEAREKFEPKKCFTNNKENQKVELKTKGKYDDKQSVISNIELGKVLYDKYKEQRDIRSALDVPRAQSEIKVASSATIDMMGKNEDPIDLEDVKVELDEFFSEIPFVAGQSINRTFNLGLSFQHAMSMLKRVHSKKEVKEVLSIARPESVPLSESSHCMGIGTTCEAMFSDWTKEDEEAWEENPWDPDLNRRRPKCTCLPNNCTTLKNVLKQLAIKNPGFNMNSLKLSKSSTTNKTESDIDGLKKPALKRAKSQTRTELLRNIRTIQIQLTPSTEILKY